MALDAAQIAQLTTELQTDPIAMGYNLSGSTTTAMKLLNDPANNVGGETTGAPLSARVLWEIAADNPADLITHGQFTDGDAFVMQQIFEIAGGLDDDLSWARTRIINLFPAADGFRTDLEALVRTLSRAEVLFGEGVGVSRADMSATGLF